MEKLTFLSIEKEIDFYHDNQTTLALTQLVYKQLQKAMLLYIVYTVLTIIATLMSFSEALYHLKTQAYPLQLQQDSSVIWWLVLCIILFGFTMFNMRTSLQTFRDLVNLRFYIRHLKNKIARFESKEEFSIRTNFDDLINS